MPKELPFKSALTLVNGLDREASGFDAVFERVLARRPILFLGLGRSPAALRRDLATLLDPPGSPWLAPAWGFRRTARGLDFGPEPFAFASRCAWPCALAAARAYWLCQRISRVVVVVRPDFGLPGRCRGSGHHKGMVVPRRGFR